MIKNSEGYWILEEGESYEVNDDGGFIIPDGSFINIDLPQFCKIGDDCKIQDGCKIENNCTIGNNCKIGNNFTWLDVKVKKFITLSNVDGFDRQIKIIIDKDNNEIIEAGCFMGNLIEFCERAKEKEKFTYIKVITSVVNALKE